LAAVEAVLTAVQLLVFLAGQVVVALMAAQVALVHLVKEMLVVQVLTQAHILAVAAAALARLVQTEVVVVQVVLDFNIQQSPLQQAQVFLVITLAEAEAVGLLLAHLVQVALAAEAGVDTYLQQLRA
jgi:hypothetical protein